MPRPPAKRFRERQRNPPATSGRVVMPTEGRNTRGRLVSDDEGSNRKDVYMSGALGQNVDEGETNNAHSTSLSQQGETLSSEAQRTPTSKAQRNTGIVPDTTRSRGYSSNFSVLGKRGDTSSRVQRTRTPAFESSMLSNFRRRPRQPSILQMMQVELDSEGDDEDFLGSLEPDDESTPFKVAKRTRISQELMATPSSMRQAQLSEMSRQITALGEVLPPPDMSEQMNDRSFSTIRAPNDRTNISEDEESLPPQRRIGRSEPPEILSQTMMPPMSSSVIASPDKDRLPLVHENKATKLKSSRISKGLKKRRSSVPARPEKVSTEALRENLLPHRRRRPQDDREPDEFDIEDDEPGTHEADDDELSYMPTRRGRPRALAEVKDRINKKSKGHSKRNASKKNDKQKQKGSERPAGVSKSSRARESRLTYSTRRGRDVTPDAENLPQGSDDTVTDPAISTPSDDGRFLSEELRLRAKYFADIARWPLEFEEVVISASQSPSPLR